MLTERQTKILHSLIQEYIVTASPVSSETIAQRHDLGVSSATIRNEMTELERRGYIVQPYTSAGRIPSTKGYRNYVESLESMSKHLTDICKGLTISQIRAETKTLNHLEDMALSVILDIMAEEDCATRQHISSAFPRS